MKTYKIIRMFRDDTSLNHIIMRGLTLEQAQTWTRSPETSSETCMGKYRKEITKQHGPWFDGYTEEG